MKNKKGFTLVELLAVIVILGVLLLIAVPAISSITADSKFNSAKDSALTVLEAARTCSMANSKLCDYTNDTSKSIDNYIDKNGTISTLTLNTPTDNPVVTAFTYVENGYTITFTYSTGCSISNAKAAINAATRPATGTTATVNTCG